MDANGQANGRLLSLDALRGFDMAWIMGLGLVIRSFCELFPGGESCWLVGQLHHADGIGFTFWDLIFPLFLFMSGVSWPFSYGSQVRRGLSPAAVHLRILKRVLVLAALQMVQSGILWFDTAHYGYPSVLIRIALTWALAALVYIHCSPKMRVAVAVALPVAYWAVLAFVPSPLVPAGQVFDCSDWTVSHVAWLNRYVSFRAWIGHDPFEQMDLILSVIQVPLALLGMFAGDILRRKDLEPVRRATKLAVVGGALAVAGYAVNLAGCPFHKIVSTPSFMLWSGGLCCLLMAAFYHVIDVRGHAGWTYPFRVIGQNSIVAYLLGVVSFFPALPVIAAVGRFSFRWLILWALSRAGLFLKA